MQHGGRGASAESSVSKGRYNVLDGFMLVDAAEAEAPEEVTAVTPEAAPAGSGMGARVSVCPSVSP